MHDSIQSLRVLLADDEPGMRLLLKKKLEKTSGFLVVGEASDGSEVLRKFDVLRPDIVFLDVDMPSLNGIDCAREIQDAHPECILIFATGHEEYMGEAFQVYAFDYLVKPFDMERLDQTLRRILSLRENRPPVPSPAIPAFAAKGGRLMLHHKGGVTLIDQNEILLIQREERSNVLYAENGARYEMPETLSEMEAKLDPALFFRCHKSYIVNISRIRNITPYGRWTYVIQLDGTRQDALITKEKYDELEKRFA